jgi:hypothetical protein
MLVVISPTPVPVLPFATPPGHEHVLVAQPNAEDRDGAQKQDDSHVAQRGCHAIGIATPDKGTTKSSDAAKALARVSGLRPAFA